MKGELAPWRGPSPNELIDLWGRHSDGPVKFKIWRSLQSHSREQQSSEATKNGGRAIQPLLLRRRNPKFELFVARSGRLRETLDQDGTTDSKRRRRASRSPEEIFFRRRRRGGCGEFHFVYSGLEIGLERI